MANILFRLREYDDAFRDLFGRVMRAHAEEAYPFLKEIPTEPRPDIHTTQVTLPSGEPLKNEPFEMKVPFRFNLSDMIKGDVDAFTASVEASGRAYGEDTMRNLLKYSGSISEAMGNAVDGRGKRFGWPVIIEVLEGVEIDFDERGEPELPSMISDKDLSKVVPAHRGGGSPSIRRIYRKEAEPSPLDVGQRNERSNSRASLCRSALPNGLQKHRSN